MDQDILRDEEPIVLAKVRLACVGPSGRPQRLPNFVRTALNKIPVVS